MTPDNRKVVRDAIYDASVIALIIMRLGNALISDGTDPLDGTELDWLGRKLDEATQSATTAMDGFS